MHEHGKIEKRDSNLTEQWNNGKRSSIVQVARPRVLWTGMGGSLTTNYQKHRRTHRI